MRATPRGSLAGKGGWGKGGAGGEKAGRRENVQSRLRHKAMPLH